MSDAPAKSGWRMPAEWEPHQATWIAWPHNRSDWPGRFGPIPWVFADIVRHLHEVEEVHILINNTILEKRARGMLRKFGVNLQRVHFIPVPTNRVWTRDYAPIFVVSKKDGLGMTDWHFNAWAKYEDWQLDDAVPELLNDRLGLPRWQPMARDRRVVLEGGSIDVNGAGLLLTTEECLLSEVQQRNPELSKADIEKTLAAYLGIKKVLWLGRGIAGDDTHGHVDDLARFVGPGTVVTVVEENKDDVNYEPLQENWRRLQAMTDTRGKPLEVIALPMPGAVVFQKQRLPASYANFYIANERVLVPTFNDPRDRVALGILGELFPKREVVGIHALDLVWGLGTLHCMTQQQPRAGR
jgi:agmatine deiminase